MFRLQHAFAESLYQQLGTALRVDPACFEVAAVLFRGGSGVLEMVVTCEERDKKMSWQVVRDMHAAVRFRLWADDHADNLLKLVGDVRLTDGRDIERFLEVAEAHAAIYSQR